MSIKSYIWPRESQARVIALFGWLVALWVLGTGVFGLLSEAPGLLRDGSGISFLGDAALRVGASVLFAALAFTPYLAAGFLHARWPRPVLAFSAILFLFNVWQRGYAYRSSSPSTSGLIDLFLPLWLLGAVALLWLVLHLAAGRREPSDPA